MQYYSRCMHTDDDYSFSPLTNHHKFNQYAYIILVNLISIKQIDHINKSSSNIINTALQALNRIIIERVFKNSNILMYILIEDSFYYQEKLLFVTLAILSIYNVSYIKPYSIKYICLCSSFRVLRRNVSAFFKIQCGKKNEIFYLPGKRGILSALSTAQHRCRCNCVVARVARGTTRATRLFSMLVPVPLDRVQPSDKTMSPSAVLSYKIFLRFFKLHLPANVIRAW